MARRVFYSFHYSADVWRTSQVRNIGTVEGSRPATDNDWETVKRGGDAAIERWINEQMSGRTCTVVLIGAQTASRPWVRHEILKTWNARKGLLGIHIHRLLDANQRQSEKGLNPFDGFTVGHARTPMANIVKTYDPPFIDSRQVYAHIQDNLSRWIEEAVQIRASW